MYKYFHSIVTRLTRFIVIDMAEENIQPSCSSILAPAFTDFSEDETSDREFESFTLFNGMVLEFCNEKKKDLHWKEIADEFKEEFCIEVSNCKGHDLSVYNKIQIFYTKLKALRGKKAQEFTNKEFKSPSNLEGNLKFFFEDTPQKTGTEKETVGNQKGKHRSEAEVK